MKRTLMAFTALLFTLTLLSCGGKETAAALGKKWCDLNGKVAKAAEGADKEKAMEARKKFEKEMEDKYKDKKEFLDEIMKEAEKCEAASEGR